MIYRKRKHTATDADIQDWRDEAIEALKPGPMTIKELANITGETACATTMRVRRFPRTFDFPTKGDKAMGDEMVDLVQGLRRWHPVCV